jgi:hypothetical protein
MQALQTCPQVTISISLHSVESVKRNTLPLYHLNRCTICTGAHSVGRMSQRAFHCCVALDY